MRIKQKQHQERLTLQGNPADRQSASASVGRDRACFIYTHTHTHTTYTVFMQIDRNFKSKGVQHVVCKDGLSFDSFLIPCTHSHTNSFLPHQYDMSDGNSSKQLSLGGTVQHHMARMPAAWAHQCLRPWQLSTRHLRIHKQTQTQSTITVRVQSLLTSLHGPCATKWRNLIALDLFVHVHIPSYTKVSKPGWNRLKAWVTLMEGYAGPGSL